MAKQLISSAMVQTVLPGCTSWLYNVAVLPGYTTCLLEWLPYQLCC
jgi:hypothetical protein